LEEEESRFLSKYATLSRDSVGRDRVEEEDDLRPCFQRDRDRILHCKAFRRLKHKTQVFLAPEGDHYRTRLTHTLEVSQIARTIAKCLRLNETLTEAIALGHDLGHTPFGHAGERVLNGLCPGGFKHSVQSVRTVEFLEKRGNGLNLTLEVRDGIQNHGTHSTPRTYEGAVVRLADKIAYINHDIDDSIRAGIFREKDIPTAFTAALGHSVRDRLNCMIRDVIETSLNEDRVSMSEERFRVMMQLRAWLFQHVYRGSAPKAEEGKAEAMIGRLYSYFLEHPEQMPEEYRYFMSECKQPIERTVCDYIAGMSDQYAVRVFQELFVPRAWTVL
jgi:deoxyguanosinetriphosphate triphosphohydrolase-like protein